MRIETTTGMSQQICPKDCNLFANTQLCPTLRVADGLASWLTVSVFMRKLKDFCCVGLLLKKTHCDYCDVCIAKPQQARPGYFVQWCHSLAHAKLLSHKMARKTHRIPPPDLLTLGFRLNVHLSTCLKMIMCFIFRTPLTCQVKLCYNGHSLLYFKTNVRTKVTTCHGHSRYAATGTGLPFQDLPAGTCSESLQY